MLHRIRLQLSTRFGAGWKIGRVGASSAGETAAPSGTSGPGTEFTAFAAGLLGTALTTASWANPTVETARPNTNKAQTLRSFRVRSIFHLAFGKRLTGTIGLNARPC
jgi:hypothetical protein